MTIKYLGNSSYESDDRSAVISWKDKEDAKGTKLINGLKEEGWTQCDLFGDGIEGVTDAYFHVEDRDEFELLKADYKRLKKENK